MIAWLNLMSKLSKCKKMDYIAIRKKQYSRDHCIRINRTVAQRKQCRQKQPHFPLIGELMWNWNQNENFPALNCTWWMSLHCTKSTKSLIEYLLFNLHWCIDVEGSKQPTCRPPATFAMQVIIHFTIRVKIIRCAWWSIDKFQYLNLSRSSRYGCDD